MESVVYPLGNLKRLSGFPCRLEEIGLMVNHCVLNRNRLLDRYFVCIGYNKEKYNTSEIERRPRFSILEPGTVLNTKIAILHDEVFFSYTREATERLDEIFAPLPKERRRFYFLPDKKFFRDIEELRNLLKNRMTLGTADKLDAFAMNMILSMCTTGITAGTELESLKAEMKIKEIAEKLKSGIRLEPLIREYGFSRRAFYYEWKRVFSVSPKQIQVENMLEKARTMLLASTHNIETVAMECGFSSYRYFHECFMKHYFCTPGEYRTRYGIMPEEQR